MSLIVETGAGLADADSYTSIASTDAYLSAAGNVAWASLTDDEKEQALRRATRFMVQAYRARWAGRRTTQTQALDWPRYSVTVDGWSIPSDAVPLTVQHACSELAFRAASGDLLPDLDTGNNQVKKDKVGPLETEFFQANVDSRARFAAVDSMLEVYFGTTGGSGMIKLVRV